MGNADGRGEISGMLGTLESAEVHNLRPGLNNW